MRKRSTILRRFGKDVRTSARRINFEEVRDLFESRGCTLLSTTYVKSKDKLSFICTCGRTAKISHDKFKRGQLCGGCRSDRSGEKTRYSIEEVQAMFKDGGCKLLAKEYKNNKQRMPYECECGKYAMIALSKFLGGQRCLVCKSAKISAKNSGANSPMYNPNITDKERAQRRDYPDYNEWRKNVFERDDYTCQCCGETKSTLNAHHIEAYSRVKELRTDVDNGITLCVDCHKQYHRDFYRNDADAESFFEFMFGEYRDPWYAGEIFD